MDSDVLHKGSAVFSLDLHPAYSNKAKEGVHLQLQSRLMRWDDDLGGLLLAYSNLQRLPSEVDIRPYFPYLQLRVKADVLVFRPKIGHVLCGQVNKMGADYIGLTVLGAINAAVGRQNIRKGLQFDHQSGSWKCKADSRGDISHKCNVLFAVDRLRIETNGIMAVMGSMKESWCGNASMAAHSTPAAFPDAEKWQTMKGIDLQLGLQSIAGILATKGSREGSIPPSAELDSQHETLAPQQDTPADDHPDCPKPSRKEKKRKRQSELNAATPAVLPEQNQPSLHTPNDSTPAKKKQRKEAKTDKTKMSALDGVGANSNAETKKKKKRKTEGVQDGANGLLQGVELDSGPAHRRASSAGLSAPMATEAVRDGSPSGPETGVFLEETAQEGSQRNAEEELRRKQKVTSVPGTAKKKKKRKHRESEIAVTAEKLSNPNAVKSAPNSAPQLRPPTNASAKQFGKITKEEKALKQLAGQNRSKVVGGAEMSGLKKKAKKAV